MNRTIRRLIARAMHGLGGLFARFKFGAGPKPKSTGKLFRIRNRIIQ